MANLITSGRKVFSKSTLGGVRKVFIATYVYYPRTAFEFDGMELISMPTTFVHQYEILGAANTFTVNFDGDSYAQSINLEFPKQQVGNTLNFERLSQLEVRILIQDNNGTWTVYGLDNGMNCDGLDIVSGGSKGEFNGYRMRFSGKEKHGTPIVLDPFSNGFIVVDEEEDFYQFQNLEAFMFQDGTLYEFN